MIYVSFSQVKKRNEGQERWADQKDMDKRRLVIVVGKKETT